MKIIMLISLSQLPPEILGSSAGRLARRFWRADTGMKMELEREEAAEDTEGEGEVAELTCWREKGGWAVWREGALPVLVSVM